MEYNYNKYSRFTPFETRSKNLNSTHSHLLPQMINFKNKIQRRDRATINVALYRPFILF